MTAHEAQFLVHVSSGLGVYYLLLCAMNWIAALWQWRSQVAWFRLFGRIPVTNAIVWFVLGCFFLLLSPIALDGAPFPVWNFWPFSFWMPQAWEGLKLFIDSFFSGVWGPVVLTVGSLGLLTLLYLGRRFFVRPAVAWTALNLSLLAMGMSMTDPDFFAIVGKPDNVPIVGLVFLLGFFNWLAGYRAVRNDDRRKQGLPPLEKEDDEKVLVWPDLVYTELICMVALTAFLFAWAILLQAPLEDPSSTVKTPNPSKAPWYFLGLQEMLVYYDPWMAGVVLPSVVLLGLMAIPFIDFNREGNGYFTIEQRKFSYLMFQFGFLELWVVLIILGTFLRGPNWNFFGPFEFWDVHKVLPQNNVNLSEIFWINWLNTTLPKAPAGSSKLAEVGYILLREAPGILPVLAYFMLLPPLMAVYIFRRFFVKMGFIRYMLLANLLLLMAALPMKMVLRWTCNLKYIIAIPEYFLNF